MCKLNDQVAEAKLTLGVMHYCNVLYVRIPAVSTKDPASAAKARAGLVRELQKNSRRRKLNCQQRCPLASATCDMLGIGTTRYLGTKPTAPAKCELVVVTRRQSGCEKLWWGIVLNKICSSSMHIYFSQRVSCDQVQAEDSSDTDILGYREASACPADDSGGRVRICRIILFWVCLRTA